VCARAGHGFATKNLGGSTHMGTSYIRLCLLSGHI